MSGSAPVLAQSAPPKSGDIWTWTTLTGDWGGQRAQLERQGVTFNLPYTTELLANLRGGIRRGAVINGLFQPQMDVDLEKLAGWQGAKFRVSGIIAHGPGLTPGYVGSISPVSGIEAPKAARLYELWYEQNVGERFSLRGGLMAADAEFMTSESLSTFFNNTFGWNELFGVALPAGGPAFPLPAPGLRLRFKPADEFYLQAAVFSGDPSGRNGSNATGELPTGTVFSFSGGAFLIAEAGYTPNQGKGAKGLPGAYKIGAWYHTSTRFGDQRFDADGRSLADPLSSGVAVNHRGNTGLYGVAEQMFYRVPGSDDQGLRASSVSPPLPTTAISSTSTPMRVSSIPALSRAAPKTRQALRRHTPRSATGRGRSTATRRFSRARSFRSAPRNPSSNSRTAPSSRRGGRCRATCNT